MKFSTWRHEQFVRLSPIGVVFMPRMRQLKICMSPKLGYCMAVATPLQRLPQQRIYSVPLVYKRNIIWHEMEKKNRFCGKFTHSYGPFAVHELRATTSCYRCAAFMVQPMS